jgi:hypothetical protein
MGAKSLKKWALLPTLRVTLQLSLFWSGDQTVSGNLTVTGTSDLQGETFTLGTRTDNSDHLAPVL